MQNKKKHSEEYFVDSRNFWWNEDFLNLMGKRWKIHKVKNMLDVGCGTGYWGRQLNKILPRDTNIIGVDQEVEWIKKAESICKNEGLNNRYKYIVGNADKIPFDDNCFDIVTCQTLLIHISNVKDVLKEMTRVLKPGGILVLIEPNNLVCGLTLTSLDLDENIDDIIDTCRFQLICERGKKNLNEGFFSIGDQLPGYLSELKFNDIEVFLSDKCRPIFPPYSSDEQKIIINEVKEWDKKKFWIWDKKDSEKYFKAGGGNIKEFNFLWKKMLTRYHKKFLAGVNSNKYATSGGRMIYCISGIKA